MKLLCVVGMLIAVSIAFAADDLPNPPPSAREATQPEQNPGTHENQKADAPDAASQPLSFPVHRQPSAVISKQETGNPSSKPSQEPPHGWVWPLKSNDTLTLALVFVGCVQIYVYCRQADYMRRGLEIADQSARAAQASAEAAKKSVQIADDTLRLTERAELIISRWQWSTPEAAHPGTISYILTNMGRTSAEVLGSYAERCVDRVPSTVASDYRQRLTERTGLVLTAQERHQVNIERDNPLLPAQWEKVRTGVIPLYVFAHVEYRDVFREEYEVGRLVGYDHNIREFTLRNNSTYNYHRKKNKQ